MTSSSSTIYAKSTLLILLVLAVVAVALYLIFSTEPRAQRSGAIKKTAMLVQVSPAEQGTFRPEIVATGTVRAEKDVALSPQISGSVVHRSDDFSPGRFVAKGTALLRIDPATYRLALAKAKSALAQAKTRLHLEMGQQDVAKQEYEVLFSDSRLSEEERELALRKPQLVAAREEVNAAQTAVTLAELDLARTTVVAPFDAQVVEQNVDVGANVQPSMTVGRLVGIERYWVEASVPLSLRRWLVFPESEDGESSECSPVFVLNRTSWPEGVHRKGCLMRLIGTLDEKTRMARVLVQIDDPLARSESTPLGAPPLMIGEFVEVRVVAAPLEDVVRIPRNLIRKGDTVWLARDDKLDIVKLAVVLFDDEYAYVREGVRGGELIVTTDLAQVKEGALLRFEGEVALDASQSETRGE